MSRLVRITTILFAAYLGLVFDFFVLTVVWSLVHG